MAPTAPPATTLPPTNLPSTTVHTMPPTQPNNTGVGEFQCERVVGKILMYLIFHFTVVDCASGRILTSYLLATLGN